MMTKKEMREDIEAKVMEKRLEYERGEIDMGSAFAFLYGYVSQALMFYIGKFNDKLFDIPEPSRAD